MKPEELEYIQHRLSRSQETIDEAELLLRNKHFTGTVNRLYYACFYAVTALLYAEGLTSATHNGVRTLFGEYWNELPRSRATGYLNRISDHFQKRFTPKQSFEEFFD